MHSEDDQTSFLPLLLGFAALALSGTKSRRLRIRFECLAEVRRSLFRLLTGTTVFSWHTRPRQCPRHDIDDSPSRAGFDVRSALC